MRRKTNPDGRPVHHRATAPLAMLTAVAVLLAACGSDQEDPESDSNPQVTETDEPEEAETDEPAESETEETGDAEEAADSGSEYQALEELVAAAEDEGEVVVYSNMVPAQQEEMVNAFEAAYPQVSVTAEQLVTGDQLTRFEAERAAGIEVVDVLQNNEEGFFASGCEEDVFADISDLPVAEQWDKEVDDPNRWNGCRSVPSINPWGIVWNTESVSEDEAPSSFEELLDERWSDGSLGMLDPAASPTFAFLYSVFLEDFGMEFMDGLREQVPAYAESSVPLSQEVAAGVYELMCCTTPESLARDQAAGKPLDGVFPDGTMISETRSAVSSSAPHPNAARLFMNWVMSPEGQEVITHNAISALPSIPSRLENISLETLRPIEPGERSDPNSDLILSIRDRLGRS